MSAPEFLMLADDPALDFLNTLTQRDGGLIEYLHTNKDVIAWMQAKGYLETGDLPAFKREVLADVARNLRDVVRKLIAQRKTGKRVDIAALNAYLVHGRYKVHLVRGVDGDLAIKHNYDKDTPEQALTQVAQAAAELLSKGNFDLIRKCEADDCILWFYDKTKSHRRRWCSMAACGNRHKVAAFRERQRNRAEDEF
jgi:predicted RNA-binding Zn ribbon-like protein